MCGQGVVVNSSLLWVLMALGVGLALGWWIGRSVLQRRTVEAGDDFRSDYFKGLNYLLNEQPDEAIKVFCELIEVTPKTLETHFALGNLFRRRGEVDRAIRLHRNIIAKLDLSVDERASATLELARDYMKAGLYDRAEELFSDLVHQRLKLAPALRNLLVIYELERDWDKAIAAATELTAMGHDELSPTLAHYYCEVAQLRWSANAPTDAAACLRKARQIDPDCVRAHIRLAEELMQAGDDAQALSCFLDAVKADHAFIPILMEPITRCFDRLGDAPGLREFLSSALVSSPSAQTVAAMVACTEMDEGRLAAVKRSIELARRFPSVGSLKCLVDYSPIAADDADATSPLAALRQIVGKLAEHWSRFRCEHCGFGAKQLHWQCPSCKHWGSVKPQSERLVWDGNDVE